MWTITETSTAAPAVLGAMAAVASAKTDPSADQQAWIDHVAQRHGWTSAERTGAKFAHEPWTAEAVAKALPGEAERRQLVRHLVLVALADARLDEAEIEQVEGFAATLGVREPAVATLRTFARGRVRALTMQLFRRSFVMSMIKAIWRDEGLRGAWRVFKALVRLRDHAKAARYQALGQLPAGTLGRRLHDHCRAHDFAFPGERKGTPEILLFHDLGHALTGYGADGLGEVQMAGFEAGFMGNDDAYSITLFGMYAFSVGAQILPDFPTQAGDFRVRPFIAAYARGEQLDVDLRFWDPWPHMERPVSDVRRQLGMAESPESVQPSASG